MAELKSFGTDTACGPERGGENSAREKELPRLILKSFQHLISQSESVPKMFHLLTGKLSKFFSISRAVLIAFSHRENSLKAIAMKDHQIIGDGLALTLPRQDSLLYDVFDNGSVYLENYPGAFDGNFFERKLLLDDDTKSLVIIPLRFEDNIRGLICYSSPIAYAFSMIEEGLLDRVFEKFGASLTKKLPASRF